MYLQIRHLTIFRWNSDFLVTLLLVCREESFRRYPQQLGQSQLSPDAVQVRLKPFSALHLDEVRRRIPPLQQPAFSFFPSTRLRSSFLYRQPFETVKDCSQPCVDVEVISVELKVGRQFKAWDRGSPTPFYRSSLQPPQNPDHR